MGREQMRNLETFKIGGSQVNEFEYQKNQGEMTEQLEQHPDEAAGTRRPTQAERVKQIMAEAHKKVEKRRKKEAAKAGHSKKTTSGRAPKAAADRNAVSKESASQKSSERSGKKATKK